MKLELILLLMINLCISSCNKDDGNNDNNFGFPKNIIQQDLTSTNDCSLPKCSEDRIVRYIAEDVNGRLYKLATEDSTYFINYPASFDSQLQIMLCNLPSEFQVDIPSGLEIQFSGNLIDACGEREAVWPIEEIYFLKLTKIEKL